MVDARLEDEAMRRHSPVVRWKSRAKWYGLMQATALSRASVRFCSRLARMWSVTRLSLAPGRVDVSVRVAAEIVIVSLPGPRRSRA